MSILFSISHEISHDISETGIDAGGVGGFESHRRHDLQDPRKHWTSRKSQYLCGSQTFIAVNKCLIR